MNNSNPKDQRGFTLLELTIVMAIIVILTTLALPNISTTLQHQPLEELTMEVSDKFSSARIRAANSGRAHGVLINLDGRGRITMHNSSSPSCNTMDWTAAGLVGDAIDLNTRFDGATAGAGTVAVDLQVVTVHPLGTQQVCFTPDGRMVDATTGEIVISNLANLTEGQIAVTITRVYDGSSEAVGLFHHIIVPFVGSPRAAFGTTDDLSSIQAGGV